jgi:hypothetical protein
MNISEQYNFKDFTTSHYRYLIQKAKENYAFSSYDSFDKNEKFILWRHDVDLSPHRALKLAQIENEENISTTYFWHLHSEYYNLFEKEVFEIVKKINGLGHNFGIHFDTHFYNTQSEEEINNSLEKEKKILEELFGTEIKVFSFHNTNPFIMSCQKWQYAGLINTYAEYFQKETAYCSDSNGYWRYNRMANLLEKAEVKKLHFLTHPEWWQEEEMSPWQKIQRAIDGRASKNTLYYKNLLATSGMKNIDWEGEV